MRYKYTKEDEDFLREHFPVGDWDAIESRFPDIERTAIYCKCQKLGIKSLNLRKQYMKKGTKTRWSDKEVAILYENYSYIPLEELQKMLPGRNADMIKGKAKHCHLISYNAKQQESQAWTDEQIQFIKDNWMIVPDQLLSDITGHTRRAVKWQREKLGLFRISSNHASYPTLSKYLRGQNQEWKNQSMENCNYQCVLTGSKNFEIHHLYSVSSIINDLFELYPDYRKDNFSDYNDKELDFLTEKFLEIQNKYPLGECIDKNIHILFHSMYGQYNNTPEQWYRFKGDYQKGLYKQYA